MPELSSAALQSTHQEREAEAAERDLVAWRIFRLLKEKLGDEFSGILVGISKAGLIVELDNYFVDGIVPYMSLKSDFYFRKSERTLVGKRTGKKHELGESVKVILASVDPILKRMTFILSSEKK